MKEQTNNVEGKGGRQRLNPVSGRFFALIASYLDSERPADVGTHSLFVLKCCGVDNKQASRIR